MYFSFRSTNPIQPRWHPDATSALSAALPPPWPSSHPRSPSPFQGRLSSALTNLSALTNSTLAFHNAEAQATTDPAHLFWPTLLLRKGCPNSRRAVELERRSTALKLGSMGWRWQRTENLRHPDLIVPPPPKKSIYEYPWPFQINPLRGHLFRTSVRFLRWGRTYRSLIIQSSAIRRHFILSVWVPSSIVGIFPSWPCLLLQSQSNSCKILSYMLSVSLNKTLFCIEVLGFLVCSCHSPLTTTTTKILEYW